MKKLRIFISSPGDVFEERAIAQRVIGRLQSEYVGRMVLEPVLWEPWFHDQAEGTIIAAFHAFDSPGDFEELLEGHLRRLVERKLPDALIATGEVAAVWKKGSPFRGLEAFEFEHAPVFFGRTKAVSDILQASREQAADGRAFVLILGMSGGGKSSVVRAGVLPMLTQPGVIEGVGLWRRAVFRPGDTPGDLLTGLAGALLKDNGLPSLDPEAEGPAALARVLRESPHSAVQLIKSALDRETGKAGTKTTSRAGQTDTRLALVIDQMEELFTQDGIGIKERKAFANTVDALARSGRVWVIAAQRLLSEAGGTAGTGSIERRRRPVRPDAPRFE